MVSSAMRPLLGRPRRRLVRGGGRGLVTAAGARRADQRRELGGDVLRAAQCLAMPPRRQAITHPGCCQPRIPRRPRRGASGWRMPKAQASGER
jgi:hypothetical protein